MAAPVLTDEQRQAGAAKSLELRRNRAAIKQWLAESKLNERQYRLAAVIEEFPACQGMRLRTLLRALPGIGVERSAKLLEQANIPLRATVRSIGYVQRSALLDQLRPK